MDLIAMRFDARHLELEGKLAEALDVCRAILRHHAHEPPTEQLLPVFLQAGDLTDKLGDRNGAAALLLLAAERYADAGLATPVIELYRRLRRLGPSRAGLDLKFARRMLDQGHPRAARAFLADLAQRQKKEKLLQTLARMESWSDDKVQQMLGEFLDRAQGIRVSTAAHPAADPASLEVTEVREVVQPPSSATRVDVVEETPTATPEVTAAPAPREQPPDDVAAVAAEPVVFVTPGQPEPEATLPHRREPARRVLTPPPRRPTRVWPVRVGIGAVLLVAGVGAGVLLAPRLRRDVAPVLAVPVGGGDTAAATPSAGADVGAPTTKAPSAPAVSLQPPGDTAPVERAGQPRVMAAATPALTVPAAVPARRDTIPVRTPPPTVTAPSTATVRQAPPVAESPPPRATPPPAAAPSAPPPEPATRLPAGVDYPIVMVEGLRIARVSREGEGRAQRVVVLQVLPSGDTLELQASDLGAASMGVGEGRVLVRAHPAGGAMGTVRMGRHLVSARAPVVPGELEALLRKLMEVVP